MTSNKLMKRLLQNVLEANSRYISINFETITEAMVSAIQEYLTISFGSSSIRFNVVWINGEKIKATAINTFSGTERNFDLSGLSEFRLREIISLFNTYLDYFEAIKDYELLSNLQGSLIYGKTVHFAQDTATITYYDCEGNERFGFCHRRDMLPKERSINIINQPEPLPFMVKRINFSHNKLRCELRLTRLSLKLPELLILELLKPNNIDYKFKCVRRIGGVVSLIGSIGTIPKDIICEVRSKLGNEYLGIYAFHKQSSYAKSIINGDISWEVALSNFFNLSSAKKLPKIKHIAPIIPSIQYSQGSFMSKITKKVKK